MAREVKVPPLVGRAEAAAILGVLPQNIRKVAGLPLPLQERGIEGFKVGITTLWPRREIEALRDKRAAKKSADGSSAQ